MIQRLSFSSIRFKTRALRPPLIFLEIGASFAYKKLTAPGGNSEERRNHMASKKPTKKLKKSKKLAATKTLTRGNYTPIDGRR